MLPQHIQVQVDRHLQAMERHELHVICDQPHTKHFRMARKYEDGSWDRAFMIELIQGDSLVLTGDFHPGRQGKIAMTGKGLRWFLGVHPKSWNYLTKKFLSKRFILEYAITEVQDAADEFRKEFQETGDQLDRKRWELLKELADNLEDDPASQKLLYDTYSEVYGCCDEMPGWGYDPSDVAIIVAIHRKFLDLWETYVPTDHALTASLAQVKDLALRLRGMAEGVKKRPTRSEDIAEDRGIAAAYLSSAREVERLCSSIVDAELQRLLEENKKKAEDADEETPCP